MLRCFRNIYWTFGIIYPIGKFIRRWNPTINLYETFLNVCCTECYSNSYNFWLLKFYSKSLPISWCLRSRKWGPDAEKHPAWKKVSYICILLSSTKPHSKFLNHFSQIPVRECHVRLKRCDINTSEFYLLFIMAFINDAKGQKLLGGWPCRF